MEWEVGILKHLKLIWTPVTKKILLMNFTNIINLNLKKKKIKKKFAEKNLFFWLINLNTEM